MCGIFGAIGQVDPGQAKYCVNLLAHRGPDGCGFWSEPGVALGHRRLAILDLSANGSQPMSYSSNRFWIVFNGEIYNFLEIKSQLEKKGYTFVTETDTEVVLAAFIEWKEECLKKFNGMWALAIWDNIERKLFLSRDRMGKKPLFYIHDNEKFVFASEMKALMPLMNEIQPNKALIRDISRQMLTYEATEKTLIDGINRFPAGSYGWFDCGNHRLSIHQWWCTLDNLIDVPERYNDQVEMFRALFFDACKLRMRSDVPIGTALSGGLDSSSVISAVANIATDHHEDRFTSDWQHAFVASFPGTVFDERKYAEMVTDSLGIGTTIINISPDVALNNINDYIYLFEELYFSNPIPFMQTYQAIKNRGIIVSIDGHGADELFGGYTFDCIQALNNSKLEISDINHILDIYYDSESQFSKLPNKYIFGLNCMAKSVVKHLINYNPFDEQFNAFEKSRKHWSKLDYFSKVLYVSTHKTVLPTLLRNYDRYSMANGVEIRMPFLDHRIVSFAFSIPWRSKIHNGYSKAIVRDAMAPFLPKEIAYRKDKIGFNSPIVEWIRGSLKEYFLDTINSAEFLQCEFINPGNASSIIKKVLNSDNPPVTLGVQAWSELAPFLWEKAFLKNKLIRIGKR